MPPCLITGSHRHELSLRHSMLSRVGKAHDLVTGFTQPSLRESTGIASLPLDCGVTAIVRVVRVLPASPRTIIDCRYPRTRGRLTCRKSASSACISPGKSKSSDYCLSTVGMDEMSTKPALAPTESQYRVCAGSVDRAWRTVPSSHDRTHEDHARWTQTSTIEPANAQLSQNVCSRVAPLSPVLK